MIKDRIRNFGAAIREKFNIPAAATGGVSATLMAVSTGTVAAADTMDDAMGSIMDMIPMLVSLMVISIIFGVLGGIFSSMRMGKR